MNRTTLETKLKVSIKESFPTIDNTTLELLIEKLYKVCLDFKEDAVKSALIIFKAQNPNIGSKKRPKLLEAVKNLQRISYSGMILEGTAKELNLGLVYYKDLLKLIENPLTRKDP
jgi:hypothetical protein